MRWFSTTLISLILVAAAPTVSAHGALVINELDVYVLSDFEAQEDSFPWEGFEIWDVYVSDGYNMAYDSHGVYFKANFAGDGTLRPTGSEVWELRFTWDVGNQSFERLVTHDGAKVESNFEQFDSQLADGNVLQIAAWAPVSVWEGQSVSNLVVLSSVDGSPRDIAPGGFYDPATGTEIPFSAPATPVFPAMGEGRLIEEVELTGPEKFLEVSMLALDENGTIDFTVTNPLSAQGQHVLFRYTTTPGWMLAGSTAPVSLDGGASTTYKIQLTADTDAAKIVDPMQIDILSDIGGKHTFYANLIDGQIIATTIPAMAANTTIGPLSEEASALSFAVLLGVVAVAFVARRRF